MTISDYSQAELNLIAALSPTWIETIKNCTINPPNLWKILAEEAFCKDKSGPEVDALRRVCNALNFHGETKIYRLTPEFDELCKF